MVIQGENMNVSKVNIAQLFQKRNHIQSASMYLGNVIELRRARSIFQKRNHIQPRDRPSI